MASDNNSGCGKIALLLGAIASLVAIIVFLTGKQSLPEFLGGPRNEQAQRTSIPTQQSYQVAKATLTPTVRATDTPSPGPSPTRTPTPTKTPIPSPTLFHNTRPGAILEVGRSWWQDGWELVLTSVRIYKRSRGALRSRLVLPTNKPPTEPQWIVYSSCSATSTTFAKPSCLTGTSSYFQPVAHADDALAYA